MKCFYHERRDSAGQCKECGKGLCKECFQEHVGLCEECFYVEHYRAVMEDSTAYRTDLSFYRKNIIRAIIGGAIGFAIITILVIASGFFNDADSFESVIGLFIAFLLIACIPFGWSAITRVFGKNPNGNAKFWAAMVATDTNNESLKSAGTGYIIGVCLRKVIKLIVSFFIGIPSAIILIVLLVKANKKLKDCDQELNKMSFEMAEELKANEKVNGREVIDRLKTN